MPKITQLSQLDMNLTYSYADYLTWQLDEAIELLKGKIMLMSPAPNVRHQDISMNLSRLLSVFFSHKKCRAYAAPFDVRLYDRKKSLLANTDIHTVVQPDLCVICDLDKLDEQGCNGAPDWIIEIVSKSTSKRDMKIKFQLYQESGVNEYWLVLPEQQIVQQFVLVDDSSFQLHKMYTDEDSISPLAFPELVIDLAEVFDTWRDN
jgi:Uma2 family endonuclease